ncbi:Uncharacterised protein [Erysipelothrix amsterdamensis]|uniref:Uncharacterized protein n=1 Tax=Erysipelothrix amsterdamensis TaxID=2929157 RepID=A0AAU9VI08_9FIRM|nr:Uncharacterised protein [Erysipelothrix sp. A18Y020d]CAH2760731.1 Uncharacterised protein [Erysipelothrix sp. A18Y020d]
MSTLLESMSQYENLLLLINPLIALLSFYSFYALKNRKIMLYWLFAGSTLVFILNALFNAFVLAPQYQVHVNLCFTLFLVFLLLYLYEYFITEKYPTFQLIGWFLLPFVLFLIYKFIKHASIVIAFLSILYIFRNSYNHQIFGWVILSLVLSCLLNPFYSLSILLIPFCQFRNSDSLRTLISSLILIYPLTLWSISVFATFFS